MDQNIFFVLTLMIALLILIVVITLVATCVLLCIAISLSFLELVKDVILLVVCSPSNHACIDIVKLLQAIYGYDAINTKTYTNVNGNHNIDDKSNEVINEKTKNEEDRIVKIPLWIVFSLLILLTMSFIAFLVSQQFLFYPLQFSSWYLLNDSYSS